MSEPANVTGSANLTGSVNIYDAKTHLSRLITRVESGEEITLSRNGRAVARLVPLEHRAATRTPGVWKSLVTISADFDDFTDDDATDWYGA
ncbi:MAG: type II toxin-antitoxin system Phd/YefM family antitoxin [Microbacteriaceae bacterium]